jgi:hypothetical protein
MATVLVAVERQHARTDHLGGREPGVIDGEASGIAHRLDAQVAPRHQPAVEDGNPGDGFMVPQSGQRAVRISIEPLERELGAERISTLLRDHRFTGGVHQPELYDVRCTTSPTGADVGESPRPTAISEDHRMDKKAKTPKKPKQTKTKDGAKAK